MLTNDGDANEAGLGRERALKLEQALAPDQWVIGKPVTEDHLWMAPLNLERQTVPS